MGHISKVPFRLMLLLLGAIFTFAGLIKTLNVGPINYSAPDNWARVLLILLGLGQGIFAVYLETKSKPMVGRVQGKRSLSTVTRDERDYYDKFSEITERQFLESIDLSKVSQLDILGHTGQSIYTPFRERLEKLIDKGTGNYPEDIRILIRAPIAEGLRRNHYVHNTIVAVGDLQRKHKNIDVRFYEAVPAIRGIICQYRGEDKAREIYMTSYYWDSPNKTKAFELAYVTKDTIQFRREEAKVLESWINQYWGKDEIHTVVFDFDDTLIKTRDVQVRAWAQALVESLEDKMIQKKNLSNPFQDWLRQGTAKSATDPILLETVKNIFIDRQLAEAIAEEIFVGVKDETIKQINKRRFEIRMGMMHKSELFEGVERILEKLSEHYNLAIISSTDEQLIENFLKEKNLSKFFPLILGKRDPSLQYEREKIHHKTSLLIKLAEIIGMPLSRMVYIGDNNSDYLATRQLGIAFIEASQAAKLVGKSSLITENLSRKPPLGSFSSFETDELLELLRRHSQKLAKHKYQI